MTNIERIESWMHTNKVLGVSLISEDSFFSPHGCDALQDGLGNMVYECEVVSNCDYDTFTCELSHEAVSLICNGE